MSWHFRHYKNSLNDGIYVTTINRVKISFDPLKDQSNQCKHGVSLALAREIDWQGVMAKPDTRQDYGEVREIGYAVIAERLYCVVFTRRRDGMRIISLRKANLREVQRYVEFTDPDRSDA